MCAPCSFPASPPLYSQLLIFLSPVPPSFFMPYPHSLSRVLALLAAAHEVLSLEKEAIEAAKGGRFDKAVVAATDAKLALDSELLANALMMVRMTRNLCRKLESRPRKRIDAFYISSLPIVIARDLSSKNNPPLFSRKSLDDPRATGPILCVARYLLSSLERLTLDSERSVRRRRTWSLSSPVLSSPHSDSPERFLTPPPIFCVQDNTRQEFDRLLPSLRLEVDRALRRLCALRFSADEYAWILKSYFVRLRYVITFITDNDDYNDI